MSDDRPIGQQPIAYVTKGGDVVSTSVLGRYALKEEEARHLPTDGFAEIYSTDELVQPLYNIEALARLLEVNPYHYRCCKTKARDTAGLGWELVPSPRLKDGTQASEDQKRFAEEFFSSQWPPVSTIFDKMMVDYEAIGDGYLELVRLGNLYDSAFVKMVHVPGHTMRIHRDGKRFCQIRGTKKVWFKAAGVEEDVDWTDGSVHPAGSLDPSKRATEILHLSNYTSRSDYYGTPDILPSLGAVQGHLSQRDYNIKFFENFGIPAYAVYVSGDYDLGEQDENGEFEIIKTIRQYFDRVQKEPHSALFFAVPSAGGEQVNVEIKPLAVDVKEASFRLFRKDNRDEVLSVHGVPPYRAGIAEEGSLGGSSAKESTQIYKDSVIKPRQELIEGHVNKFILEGLEVTDWVFQLIEVDTSDEAHDLEVLGKVFDCGGASPNDFIRYFGARFGIEPIEHPAMDAHYVQGKPIDLDGLTAIDDPDSIEAVKAFQSRLSIAVEAARKSQVVN
jgi:PBSX family phage portal protein